MEIAPLGLEPDEPGSMLRLDAATVQILARSPRSYDGCDLHVRAPLEANLIVQLSNAGQSAGQPLQISLARLARGFVQQDLDEHHNRLLAQRSPGDTLRVRLQKDSLVFTPGETLELDVTPSELDVTAGAGYLLSATLSPARTDQPLWNQDHELRVEAGGELPSTPLRVPLPATEGVFDLRLSLYPKRLTTSLVRGKPLTSRKVQMVVVEPTRFADSRSASWQAILDFDPANPRWLERLARLPSWPKIPNLPQQPLAGGESGTKQHLGRTWVELRSRAWQAYPLSITTPGVPYLLEIEYPSDCEQTLSISLIEPNAAGKVGPIGLDSGIDVAAPTAGHVARVDRHRLVFWPQTRSPYVLVVNRRDTKPAIVGKISVLAGPAELPPLKVYQPNFEGRTLAAYYDKPLVAENFSASEALDPISSRTFKDWVTFYDGCQRLIQTLQYSGYNALVLTAACRGSAIYPSQLLEPTPEYDTGVFFDSGQDPIRKDVLELLFRLCDRNSIKLIPAVQFAAPLPELEAIRQADGDAAAGLAPLGPDGRTWMERIGPRRGLGVYYNALDQRVQSAMIGVVSEIAARYGRHASFGGVAIQAGGDSYALLPDETCSYDDATIARFAAETRLTVPAAASASPQETLAARAAFLQGEGEQRWLEWRAARLTEMFANMRAAVTSVRPDAALYLTPVDLLGSQPMRLALRPMLPSKEDPAALFSLIGLDVERLAEAGVILPRPQRIIASAAAAPRELDRHWNSHPELDALFGRASGGSGIHYLEPAPLPLPKFDAQSPFGADKTRTLLISQILPAGATQRERFARSIAKSDSPLLMDGGWLLPLGQENALEPLVKVFRRLPPDPFPQSLPLAEGQSDDVVVRWLPKNGKTYFYAVNTTSWPLTAKIVFQSPEPLRLLSYSEERQANLTQDAKGAVWTIQLEPYDLVGGEIAGTGARIVACQVAPPANAAEFMREQIRNVGLRANIVGNALRLPPPPLLANPSFEAPLDSDLVIPGWVAAQGPGVVVEVEPGQEGSAANSLHVASRPDQTGRASVVWVRSDPISARPTGRLRVVASIRIAESANQPKLRLAVEGKLDGQVYYRRANVGQSETADGAPVTPLTAKWSRINIALDDLPTSGLTELRVGFDLMGEGEVWIDDVEVYDLWFEERERNELLKSIYTAHEQLKQGRLTDCLAFIESYWPSFLREHVPLSSEPTGGAPSRPDDKTQLSGGTALNPGKRTDRSANRWDLKNWLPTLPKWR